MEKYDPDLAARVWKRVHADRPAEKPSILPLIQNALEDAAVCQLLSQRFRGRQSALFRQLARQLQGHAACLKGIYRLQTGAHAQVQLPKPENKPTPVLLQRCYGRTLQALSSHESCRQDPEYGHVFSRLARETQAAGQLLLQLFGSLPYPDSRKNK